MKHNNIYYCIRSCYQPCRTLTKSCFTKLHGSRKIALKKLLPFVLQLLARTLFWRAACALKQLINRWHDLLVLSHLRSFPCVPLFAKISFLRLRLRMFSVFVLLLFCDVFVLESLHVCEMFLFCESCFSTFCFFLQSRATISANLATILHTILSKILQI